MNLKAPDHKSRRRYQLITVVRDDKPAEFKLDMGLSRKYKADQFQILGGAWIGQRFEIMHTVAEMRGMAESIRNQPAFDKMQLTMDTKKNKLFL